MFSITEDFAKAQYDYTRERLGSGPRRPGAEPHPRRRGAGRRAGFKALLFHRNRLRPALPDC